MSVILWSCKKTTRRVEMLKLRKKSLTKLIKTETNRLNNLLKQLTPKESVEYGYQMGFIEKADYD